MRIKQPNKLFPARNEKRPGQDIPTEAARIKARMARIPKPPADVEVPKDQEGPKSES
jgi:hypothetical protein